MQIGTIASIGKVVFAIVIIAILIYIAVKKPVVNMGNWIIDGSDDNMLKIISPNKTVVFGVDQLNSGIRIQNYLIKGDEHALQFFSPDIVQMANMQKKRLGVGSLAFIDNTNAEEKYNQGLWVYEHDKPLVVLNDELLRWPSQNMIIKAAGPQFQVYTGDKIIVNEPKSVTQSALYNII
jgi:hypothetical protein